MKALTGHSEREWILFGMAESCAEKGFEETSAADACEAAGVPEEWFAELFASREECLGEAMSWLLELVYREAQGRASADASWEEKLRSGVSALLDVLAARPAFAHLAMIEAPLAGGRATILYEVAKARLVDFLEEGEALSNVKLPASAARGALAGAEALLTTQVAAGDTERLSSLGASITFMLAVPYLGRAEAMRLADGPPRRGHLRAVA